MRDGMSRRPNDPRSVDFGLWLRFYQTIGLDLNLLSPLGT